MTGNDPVVFESDSGLEIGRQILALLAYPPGVAGNDARRPAFIKAMRELVAHSVDPGQRPEDLRHPPRARACESKVRKGMRAFERSQGAAWMLMTIGWRRSLTDCDWSGKSLTYAALRLTSLPRMERGGDERVRETNTLNRVWKPARPVLHLALAVWLARWEWGVGRFGVSSARLLLDDSWPLPVLEAAEFWRTELPRRAPRHVAPEELIPITGRLRLPG
jgi:hypothetical protein